MRVLAVIIMILIPLSFLTDLWGMNFDTRTSPCNMPELEWQLGYPFVLRLMAIIAGVILFTSEKNDERAKKHIHSEK